MRTSMYANLRIQTHDENTRKSFFNILLVECQQLEARHRRWAVHLDMCLDTASTAGSQVFLWSCRLWHCQSIWTSFYRLHFLNVES